MLIQSFPALRWLRVWVALFYLGGMAAAAQVPGQLSDRTKETMAVSTPGFPDADLTSIPVAASAAPSAPALTLKDKVQLALGNYERLLQWNRTKGNREQEAEDLVGMASAYRAIQQEHKAADFFQSAIPIFHELGNREYEATALAHVGDVYREWGFADAALRFYRKALGVYAATSDKDGEAAALNNSGAAWFKLNNRGKCLESFRQAMALYQENHADEGEAIALSNLGAAYLYFMDDPEKAIDTLGQAVSKLEVIGDNADEANALEMMGFAWLKAHRETAAGENFRHAEALYHALGDSEGEARVAGHMTLLEQGSQSRTDPWSVSSVVSPEPLVLTATRLRVLEITR